MWLQREGTTAGGENEEERGGGERKGRERGRGKMEGEGRREKGEECMQL